MHSSNFRIKVDCRKNALRVVISDTCNGREVASSQFYSSALSKRLLHPIVSEHRCTLNYYNSCMEEAVKQCLVQAGHNVVANIKTVQVDTTPLKPVTNASGFGTIFPSVFDNNEDTSRTCLK